MAAAVDPNPMTNDADTLIPSWLQERAYDIVEKAGLPYEQAMPQQSGHMYTALSVSGPLPALSRTPRGDDEQKRSRRGRWRRRRRRRMQNMSSPGIHAIHHRQVPASGYGPDGSSLVGHASSISSH
eukprot:8305544-Pyramimonas_sp.AAC.3